MIPQPNRHKSSHTKGEENISDRFSLHLPYEVAPDLIEVLEAWPHLPEAIRAGIVAMVKASSKGQP